MMELLIAKTRRLVFFVNSKRKFLLELVRVNVYVVLIHHVIQVLFEKHVSIVEVVIEEVMEMNVVEFFDNI